MPEGWPVTIVDDGGYLIEVDVNPSTGRVYLCTSPQGVLLSAAKRAELNQVYVAASWAAEGKVPGA